MIGFNRKSFQDWTRTRNLFERFAIEEFAGRQEGKTESLKTLGDLVDAMRLLKDQQKDLKASIDLDLGFHRQLIGLKKGSKRCCPFCNSEQVERKRGARRSYGEMKEADCDACRSCCQGATIVNAVEVQYSK